VKSILQYNNVCFYHNNECSGVLCTHHVFGGHANRKKSDDWGLTIRVCAYHHNMGGKKCVHENKQMQDELKRYAQEKFEELYDHDTFMEVFHKNYLL